MPAGRPSGFDPEFCKWAQKLTKLGATDREVAEFLEVTESTLYRWKHEFPEFSESFQLGKEEADARVVQSLYRRATGYSFDAVKIFPPKGDEPAAMVPYVEHVPPDTGAATFWLKNRQRKDWADRISNEISSTGLSIGIFTGDEARRLQEEQRQPLTPDV